MGHLRHGISASGVESQSYGAGQHLSGHPYVAFCNRSGTPRVVNARALEALLSFCLEHRGKTLHVADPTCMRGTEASGPTAYESWYEVQEMRPQVSLG